MLSLPEIDFKIRHTMNNFEFIFIALNFTAMKSLIQNNKQVNGDSKPD